jgi:hypothetical protein
MEEIEEIITNLFITVKAKRSVILSQQYEKAAQLRDNERVLEDKLYKKIFGDPNVLPGYTGTPSENLDKYFLENYNVKYSELFNEDIFTQVKREMILRKLGI